MAAYPHIYVSNQYGTNPGTSDTSQQYKQSGDITNTSPDTLLASDVYDSIGSAVSATGASPSDGDTIYVCDNHNASYDNLANPIINDNGVDAGVGLKIVSVDHLNVENYKPGASDTLSDTVDDYQIEGNGLLSGVNLGAGDNVISFISGSPRIWSFRDMTISAGAGLDLFLTAGREGTKISLLNVTMNSSGVITEGIKVSAGNKLTWTGGSITGAGVTGLIDNGSFINGGGTIIIKGVDLSLVSGTILPTVTAVQTDVFLLRLEHCKLHATVTLTGTLTLPQHRFEMFNCDNATDDVYHRFYIEDGAGSAKNYDSIYVTANQAWYGGIAKSSIKVETTSLCSPIFPFVFELPAQYADLASTSTDKITVNLVTDASLTNTDIAAFLIYADGGTAIAGLHITSGATVGTDNLGIDPIGAGAALTNVGGLVIGDWAGASGLTPYTLVLDTNATGQACMVSVRIEVYTDIGTNVLYIDSELVVGA